MQHHGRVLVSVHAGDPGIRSRHLDAELLVQLASERDLQVLSGIDLAAGKLPPARVDLARRAPAEEKRAVGALDHRRDDFDHLALLRVPARPVPGELVGNAAAARAALERPLETLFL